MILKIIEVVRMPFLPGKEVHKLKIGKKEISGLFNHFDDVKKNPEH